MAPAQTKEESKKTPKRSGSRIAVCTKGCRHSFQDKTYGAGRRLFNLSQKVDKMRCTVCSNLQDT